MAASKSSPKDAQVMAAILKDMGVNEYEPRVINQMLEFTYRYVTDVLDDAKVYSNHAGKKTIDVDDVKLAVQCKLDHSFTTPPPRDLLMDIAKHKNNTALPLIKPYIGPKLPPDRYCLTQPNFKLKTIKKQKVASAAPVMNTIAPTPRFTIQSAIQSGGMKPNSVSSQPQMSLLTRPAQPALSIRPPSQTSMPVIRLNTGGSGSLGQPLGQPISLSAQDIHGIKRKREDQI